MKNSLMTMRKTTILQQIKICYLNNVCAIIIQIHAQTFYVRVMWPKKFWEIIPIVKLKRYGTAW